MRLKTAIEIARQDRALPKISEDFLFNIVGKRSNLFEE